jgi:hypothetical protein
LVYSLIKVLMKVIMSSITHGVTGAHWCNLHSRGIMAAVGTAMRELSGERGSYFLRGKAHGEVKLCVDKVKRRKERRKVGLSIITLRGEIGVALGAPCDGKKMGRSGVVGVL